MAQDQNKQNSQSPDAYTVAALYSFVHVENVDELQDAVHRTGSELGITGTFLVAPEGINATVAGTGDSIEAFIGFLKSDVRFKDIEPKYSTSAKTPF